MSLMKNTTLKIHSKLEQAARKIDSPKGERDGDDTTLQNRNYEAKIVCWRPD